MMGFVFAAAAAAASTPSSSGDALCPCLTEEELASVRQTFNATAAALNSNPADDAILQQVLHNPTYGFNCAAHDESSSACTGQTQPSASVDPWCDNVVPRPARCSEGEPAAYCPLRWCYVRSGCELLHEHSVLSLLRLSYSYATCGDTDEFTPQHDTESLQGKVLRVAFRHNTAGSRGSYHPQPGYGHRDDEWYGPYPELITEMASRRGFAINITEPPAWILERARLVTNETSSFTQCVFAAGLGCGPAGLHMIPPRGAVLGARLAFRLHGRDFESSPRAGLAPYIKVQTRASICYRAARRQPVAKGSGAFGHGSMRRRSRAPPAPRITGTSTCASPTSRCR